MTLTAARLRELTRYDPLTGAFTWISTRRGRARAGHVAGTAHSAGYIQIRVDAARYFAHRLAWLYVHGAEPVGHIDHMNGKRNDNRIENLRDVTVTVNVQNTFVARRSNKTGFLGVSKRPDGYEARIMSNGTNKYLGRFATPELAYGAYLCAKLSLHPHSQVRGN